MLYLADVSASFGVTRGIADVIKLMLYLTDELTVGVIANGVAIVIVGMRSGSYVIAPGVITIHVTVVGKGVDHRSLVSASRYVTIFVAIVIVNVKDLAGVVTRGDITLLGIALARVGSVGRAYLYVTGLVAIVIKNVINVADVSATLNVTGSVAGKAVNVGCLAYVVTSGDVAIRVAHAVKDVVAFPDSDKRQALVNGVIGKIPKSSVKERPTNENVAVLDRCCGRAYMVTLADDHGLYHISSGGIEFNR